MRSNSTSTTTGATALPSILDPNHLDSDGFLIPKATFDELKKKIISISNNTKCLVSKNQLNIDYDILYLPFTNKPPQFYTIYSKPLGRGTQGLVQLVQNSESGTLHAMKTPLPSSRPITEQQRQSALQEANFLRATKRLSTVILHQSGNRADIPTTIMALAPGDDVDKLLDSKSPPMTQTEKLKMCNAIALAVKQLHEAGIIHCDLKPANIRYDRHTDMATIMDFGASILLTEGKTNALTGVRGTPLFAPPEIGAALMKFMKDSNNRSDISINKTADIYSLGITLGHILGLTLTDTNPFPHYELNEIKLNRDTSNEMATLLRSMTSADQTARPPIEEVTTTLNDIIEKLQANVDLTDSYKSPHP